MPELSDKAKEMLTTALAGDGLLKGLIVAVATDRYRLVKVGNGIDQPSADELVAVQVLIDELAANHMITRWDAGAYMVTPLGCLTAGWSTS